MNQSMMIDTCPLADMWERPQEAHAGRAAMITAFEAVSDGFETWLQAVRFYRSGKTKNAQLSDGERVILCHTSTAGNFRTDSRDFLLHLYRQRHTALAPPQPDGRPEPTHRCLKCGKVSAGMFCNAGCKARWTSSMSAWQNRMTRTRIEGEQPLF